MNRVRSCATALLFALAAGCSAETGMMLEVVGAPGQSSVAAGVATLQIYAAHQSWCDRWVEDSGASGARADVHSRDLAKHPFTFWLKPSHTTDLADPVDVVVVARDANDNVIGAARFGAHPYRLHKIDKYTAHLELAARTDASYVAQDGCLCLPGAPWMGTGSQMGCDTQVVTSYDRLVDTAGCELPPGARQLTQPVCDGQQYDGETVDRALPCFATAAGSCRTQTRNCHDADGIAWGEECVADGNSPALPSGALCDAYLACEQQACGDLTACLLQKVPAARTLHCTLQIDPSTAAGAPIAPCAADGKWQVVLEQAATGAACVASVVDGVTQGPFQLGFLDANAMGPQAIAATCPVTFAVDSIDAPSPAEVPDAHDLDVTIGDQVVHIHLQIERVCGGPALSCK